MSPKYKLNRTDLPALLKSAGLGIGLSVVGWLTGFVDQIDYGMWTPIVLAIVPPALAAVKRFLTDYSVT